MSRGDRLAGSRVYLSGPMDFVASRKVEKEQGWRSRVKQFLEELGVLDFDPWDKPSVRWFYEYGRETPRVKQIRSTWTFEMTTPGKQARSRCVREFWETMHIDLRMVDNSDFMIAYCPTNIYSVGTVHEIVVASEQHKPVLFVSPKVDFPTLEKLHSHLVNDKKGQQLLRQLESEVPVKPNPRGIPSLWYMALLGGHSFFDGFGFSAYRRRFHWSKDAQIDKIEGEFPPKRQLLAFLSQLNSGRKPVRFDAKLNRDMLDDDWLLLILKNPRGHSKGTDSPR